MVEQGPEAVLGTTWYIAANEPGAADTNDGSSPIYLGKSVGPWASPDGPRLHELTLRPGDTLVLWQAHGFDQKSTLQSGLR